MKFFSFFGGLGLGLQDEGMGKAYPNCVSKNRDTPKSSILIEFSIISHKFWGTPIFGNTHILVSTCFSAIVTIVDGFWTSGRSPFVQRYSLSAASSKDPPLPASQRDSKRTVTETIGLAFSQP